jgi:hypothetical protein
VKIQPSSCDSVPACRRSRSCSLRCWTNIPYRSAGSTMPRLPAEDLTSVSTRPPPRRCGHRRAWAVQPGGRGGGHARWCRVQPSRHGRVLWCLAPRARVGAVVFPRLPLQLRGYVLDFERLDLLLCDTRRLCQRHRVSVNVATPNGFAKRRSCGPMNLMRCCGLDRRHRTKSRIMGIARPGYSEYRPDCCGGLQNSN